MSLCKTCNGRGEYVPTGGAGDPVVSPCPAGCVALRCQVQEPGQPVRDVTEYHDSASVLLWCKTHRASVWRPDRHCWYALMRLEGIDRIRGLLACRIVPYPMPTEPAGELA